LIQGGGRQFEGGWMVVITALSAQLSGWHLGGLPASTDLFLCASVPVAQIPLSVCECWKRGERCRLNCNGKSSYRRRLRRTSRPGCKLKCNKFIIHHGTNFCQIIRTYLSLILSSASSRSFCPKTP
jgi:hypothetical protein